ncbi:acetoin utilization protein AcuC [Aquipuribacter nitratireducens]|uniref:Acetoin utilization protein AcuC n=1 Tax=Aquipuribacter nitratireducens TaxID=650104 RepID=A0ABW0GRC0_9MICO
MPPGTLHRTRVVWDEDFVRYDFGPGHPLAPVRIALTARLCRDLGLFRHVDVVDAPVADDALLRTVHTAGLVAAVRAASLDVRADVGHGVGTVDTPAFPGMHDSAARVFAGSVALARAIAADEVRHAVNFAGGLHHASADAASGFCVYNDCAGAIRALLDAGVERVVYVDTDVHHGDGTESVFWDDPRVTTISLHESGRTLFPGTGYPTDVGGPGAEGTAVNVALPAGTGDAGWLRALHAVARPVVREVRPQVLVTQHGCDTHVLDPLAHLRVSVDGQRAAAALLHDLAHEVTRGRWLALGGGGYELVDVVPRAWAHLVGIAAHQPVDPTTAVPPEWLEHVVQLTGQPGPRRMTDGVEATFQPWEAGYDPADPVDQAILATRKAVFPLLGLDPWFD